jgi:hypothetical protein
VDNWIPYYALCARSNPGLTIVEVNAHGKIPQLGKHALESTPPAPPPEKDFARSCASNTMPNLRTQDTGPLTLEVFPLRDSFEGLRLFWVKGSHF